MFLFISKYFHKFLLLVLLAVFLAGFLPLPAEAIILPDSVEIIFDPAAPKIGDQVSATMQLKNRAAQPGNLVEAVLRVCRAGQTRGACTEVKSTRDPAGQGKVIVSFRISATKFQVGANNLEAEMNYAVGSGENAVETPYLGTKQVTIAAADTSGPAQLSVNLKSKTFPTSGKATMAYEIVYLPGATGRNPTRYTFDCDTSQPPAAANTPSSGTATEFVCEYNLVPSGSPPVSYAGRVEALAGSDSLATASFSAVVTADDRPQSAGTGTSGGDLGGPLISTVNIIIGAILALVRAISYWLITLILLPILEATLKLDAGAIASGPIIAGWTFVRDIVNMFFILALIVIAFGTILKLESYNYKKLLAKLILMALLVNFSLVIGRIIIQVLDVVQFTFLPVTVQVEGQLNGISGVKYVFQSLVSEHADFLVGAFKNFSFDSSTALAATATLLFQFTLELMVFVTFGALAIFMVIRTVALWILLILSPLAYGLTILPATADQAKKWWNNFIKYALFAPIMAFFLRLALALYRDGLQIIPGAGTNDDIFTYLRNLTAKAGGEVDFSQFLVLMIVYLMILAFLWAALLVTKNMSIFGASAITSLAERGLKAPYALGGKGIKGIGKGALLGSKALATLGAEKLLEQTGVDIRPGKWIEGWKKSREINREAREAKGAAKALDRKSALASPTTFFQRYWSPAGIRRVLGGGEKKGRELLDQAKSTKARAVLPDNQQMREAKNLRRQAGRLREEAAAQPGVGAIDKRIKAEELIKKAEQLEAPYEQERKDKLIQARALESQGKKLIAPDDYLTQQKIRSAIDEEKKTIHTNNWHELVDLFDSAEREGKPLRAAAIMEHLTKTYNENELINSSRYARNMSAEESADHKAHKEGEFFEFSPEGAENFRKLILEEKFKLGHEASMMIMSDVSDIAEDTKHFEIMRMYISENGKLRFKRPDEREPEVSAELDKMSTGRVLSEGNRLVGSRELPDADYDITQKRTTLIEPTLVAYYLKNYPAVKFLLNRGQMNPSQAKAVAERQNKQVIMAAAELLDDTVEVEKIEGVSQVLARQGLRDTRRNQYKEIMNQLVHYGETKGAAPSGESRIDQVQKLFKREGGR